MALSKALRLLGRLDASGEWSVLLEARGRGDCLLFEAGTVATLGECDRAADPGLGPRAPGLPSRGAAPQTSRNGRLPSPR